jgi:isoquinoline 1-oxidoreductase alpha subunit
MKTTMNVNGVDHELDVSDDTPLLWVLRDHLGMIGTKYGCGVAQCGACTVHIDGQAMRSCQLPIAGVGAAKVTTIEGLTSAISHQLQKLWVELNVAQCGYCQAGMLMAASALLENIPKPTDADISTYLDNICRCGTYPRVRAAIHRVAENA